MFAYTSCADSPVSCLKNIADEEEKRVQIGVVMVASLRQRQPSLLSDLSVRFVRSNEIPLHHLTGDVPLTLQLSNLKSDAQSLNKQRRRVW